MDTKSRQMAFAAFFPLAPKESWGGLRSSSAGQRCRRLTENQDLFGLDNLIDPKIEVFLNQSDLGEAIP